MLRPNSVGSGPRAVDGPFSRPGHAERNQPLVSAARRLVEDVLSHGVARAATGCRAAA
jgi:hypothetical protein